MFGAKIRYCGLFTVIFLGLLFSGCNNSEYMMQDPDVLSGTVSVGQRVSGTVHVITSSRYDQYEGAIDPESGWFSITIKQPDGPYLIWAILNETKPYFSYSKGERTSESDATDDTESNHAGGVYTHTANINPITDLIMAMTYLAEPQVLFYGDPYKKFPDTSRLRQKTNDIEDILGPTLVYLDDTGATSLVDPYDFFQDDFYVESNYDILLGILAIEFTARKLILTIKDAYIPEGYENSKDLEFFTFDLDEDDFLGDPKNDGFPEKILDRLKTIEGFPLNE